jgi:hypothetical protein
LAADNGLNAGSIIPMQNLLFLSNNRLGNLGCLGMVTHGILHEHSTNSPRLFRLWTQQTHLWMMQCLQNIEDPI